ncbi:MAG: enoyl-CoA hydratase [Hyphomonas sp.]
MADYREILTGTEAGVLTITLNRPERLNAWTGIMQTEVETAIRAGGADDGVRCIVITGAGRGFCAGADMNGLQSIQASGGEDYQAKIPDLKPKAVSPLEQTFPGRFGHMFACPKPIIAAINGPCAGIGLILTLFADLRYAAAEAKFTTAFAQRGLIAEHGIAWQLPRLVGEANALDLLFTARKFDGAEAERLGLVNRALPGVELMAYVGEVAQHLATQVSPRSVAIMKRQIRESYFQTYGESLAVADAEMERSFATQDFKEGVASFVERRAPAFTGR